MKLVSRGSGFAVETDSYRFRIRDRSWFAVLADATGREWAELCLVADVETIDGPDETDVLDGPEILELDDRIRLTWRLGSTRWQSKRLVLDCTDGAVAVRTEVDGSGRLTDVSLLGGRSVLPDGATGSISSRPRFATLFSPAPASPACVVVPASVSTDISAAGGAEPGRGQWVFTPAPFCYAVTRSAAIDPLLPPDDDWLTFSLVAAPGEQRFIGFGYRGVDTGFRFVLDYEGHTKVQGAWSSPWIVISPAADPYAGLRAYRTRVHAASARTQVAGQAPDWWRQPIFCGWGAQCAIATERGLPLAAAAGLAGQTEYDSFLAALADQDVIPGTVVIDDKWQLEYATGEPDPSKWPDLRGWIADRHHHGQRVILWWKAWNPEGLPPEWTVRTSGGRPIAVDPGEPAARAALAAAVACALDPQGLGADGLKIDFTARTPSGASLVASEMAWGVDLLRALLATIHEAAKSANPESLLIGQVVEPSMADLVDMIRLNDLLRLDDHDQPPSVVPQMGYRAAVVRAACPDHLIDTDDWCAVDLTDWRRYAELKPQLGVPALYYATHLDRTGERFTADDYALIRNSWRAYRGRYGLPEPDRASAG